MFFFCILCMRIIKGGKEQKGAIQVVPLLVIGVILVMAVYSYFIPLSDKCLIFPELDACKASKVTVFSESTGLLKPTETAARYSFEKVQLFR